jgi:hypothetical protein
MRERAGLGARHLTFVCGACRLGTGPGYRERGDERLPPEPERTDIANGRRREVMCRACKARFTGR